MESKAAPLLSICLPTYNRAALLRQALDSILAQVAGRPDVEIVVLDNASPDQTPAVVGEYMQRHSPQLRYVRHPQNLGFDRNIIACVEQARGEYVSLFSDDDIALPGAFEGVLQEIARRHPAIICLRLYPFRGNDYRRLWGLPGPKRDIVFQNGKEFFKFARLGFLSVLILRADYARQFIPNVNIGLGSAHVDIAARIALRLQGPFVYLGTQTVAARAPDKPTSDSFTLIHINFPAYLDNLVTEGLLTPNDSRGMLVYLIKGPLWRDLLRKKCLGDNQQLKSQQARLYQYYGWHPLFHFYAGLIFNTPKPVLWLPYQLALRLNSLKRYWFGRQPQA